MKTLEYGPFCAPCGIPEGRFRTCTFACGCLLVQAIKLKHGIIVEQFTTGAYSCCNIVSRSMEFYFRIRHDSFIYNRRLSKHSDGIHQQ